MELIKTIPTPWYEQEIKRSQLNLGIQQYRRYDQKVWSFGRAASFLEDLIKGYCQHEFKAIGGFWEKMPTFYEYWDFQIISKIPEKGIWINEEFFPLPYDKDWTDEIWKEGFYYRVEVSGKEIHLYREWREKEIFDSSFSDNEVGGSWSDKGYF